MKDKHDRATCEFCRCVSVMNMIMSLIEGLPDFGVPLLDDPVTDVFNAADEAKSALRCRAAYDEDLQP